MIKKGVVWVLRLLVPVVIFGLIAFLARFPFGSPPEKGQLRLAWRLVGEKVRICRDYTDKEKVNLPQHMQRGQHCNSRLLEYRLVVSLNGQGRVDLVVTPPGAHGDRPMYVQEDFLLKPGMHRVAIRFVPQADFTGEVMQQEDPAEHAALTKALETAGRYELEREVEIRKGAIFLIDLNEGTGEFVIHQG